MSQSMEAFITSCCAQDDITLEQFRKQYVALPCRCDVDNEPHWTRIPLEVDQICDHLAFNTPTYDGLMHLRRSK